ncbi:hypothetical protein D3C71_1807580 [compost metagenome]
MRCDRSPWAIARVVSRTCSSGRQIEIMFSSVSGTTSRIAMATASTNSHWVWSATSCSMAINWSTWALSSLSSSTMVLSASANSAMAFAPMRLAMVAVS